MEIIKIILVTGLAAMTILSGIFKLSGNKKLAETMATIGVAQYMPLLGIAEIVFALLFLYPPTRSIGFILLICYFSGALATDLSHKRAVTAPLVFLILLFTTAYINNPGLLF
ncbi:MAG: DoxX family protein [Chitinophagaceae bacterium]